MKKILVTGANGQLGNEIKKLISTLKPDGQSEYLLTDYKELDITDSYSLDVFFKIYNVGIVINCAAFTAVDNAEDPDNQIAAFGLNAGAAGNLAKACAKYDCALIHISTDYVFDGLASEPYKEVAATIKVKSIYGESKRMGEELILKYCPKHVIIRTSWLYSSFGSNFVKTMLRLATQKDSINVVNDQVGSPTYARDLAGVVLKFVELINRGDEPFGIFHYTNEGVTTWYDFALEIKKIKDLKFNILPVSTQDYGSKAERPLYSVLDKSKLISKLGVDIPQWQDSLRECLELL